MPRLHGPEVTVKAQLGGGSSTRSDPFKTRPVLSYAVHERPLSPKPEDIRQKRNAALAFWLEMPETYVAGH